MILQDLNRTTAELLQYFDLDEESLDKRYGEGKWKVRQILHHITDAETVLYERIRRTISKPNQVIWAFDQDAWCENMDYKSMPLEISRNIFLAVRAGICYLAEHHYEKSGANEYVHSETGLRTLKNEFDKVVGHCENHLEQIRRALGSDVQAIVV